MSFENTLHKAKIISIAKMHFIDGKNKSQIAKELGISRFKVARLIDDAISSKMIKFIVTEQNDISSTLAEALQKEFSLKNAIVISNTDLSDTDSTRNVAKAAASFLEEVIKPGMKLGVSWGHTIATTIDEIKHLPPIEIIQTTGSALASNLRNSAIVAVHKLAEISGGNAFPIYLPLWINDESAVEKLKEEHNFSHITKKFNEIDLLIASVGSWQSPTSGMFDSLPENWRNDLLKQNVCTDFCAVPINKKGQFVDYLDKYSFGINAQQIAKIPHIVLVAEGVKKHEAIYTALKTGCITTLIINMECANFLLEKNSKG